MINSKLTKQTKSSGSLIPQKTIKHDQNYIFAISPNDSLSRSNKKFNIKHNVNKPKSLRGDCINDKFEISHIDLYKTSQRKIDHKVAGKQLKTENGFIYEQLQSKLNSQNETISAFKNQITNLKSILKECSLENERLEKELEQAKQQYEAKLYKLNEQLKQKNLEIKRNNERKASVEEYIQKIMKLTLKDK